jgi:hypothetical protein
MPLTPEQQEEWDALKDKEPEAEGSQTPEQARALFIHSFRHLCALEGIGAPSVEDVAAELD